MTITMAGIMVLVAVVSYFLGCFNGAIIVSKYILHNDVRQHGSGNAGLTNFYRVFGGKLTLVVILLDMLKAVIAVLMGGALLGSLGDYAIPVFGKLWAAIFCMLGHDFPCMFGFKGGKGVLSGGAMTLVLDWRVALACWGVFLLAVLLTRYISLGSIGSGVAFVVSCGLLYHNWINFIMALFCALLLEWGHRNNIVRLIHGNENKFSFHKKGDKEQ